MEVPSKQLPGAGAGAGARAALLLLLLLLLLVSVIVGDVIISVNGVARRASDIAAALDSTEMVLVATRGNFRIRKVRRSKNTSQLLRAERTKHSEKHNCATLCTFPMGSGLAT